MADRADLPTIEDDSREYWDAAADGRLLIARCGSCGRVESGESLSKASGSGEQVDNGNGRGINHASSR